MSPCWIRYGSVTSSMVLGDSQRAAEIVSRPTGPPPKSSLIAPRYFLSSASRPSGSTCSWFKDCSAVSKVTIRSPLMLEKSHTRRKSRKAIRGVPRERRAISRAASSSIENPINPAFLLIMKLSYSTVSKRNGMPKRSRRGCESRPRRVVAATMVNGCTSNLRDLADCPSPINISILKSSIAG